MNSSFNKLAQRYAGALREYLADPREAMLERAYELGRGAIARGLGVLDMAAVHQEAMGKVLLPLLTQGNRARHLKAAETFFLEVLSPFEITHRGFREANLKLQDLIATLEKRNVQLAGMNLELKNEIGERKRTERALRDSERHYRQLFDQASLMQENLRRLSNEILHVQEEERKRISRELHDEVGQALTAVSMNLAVLQITPLASALFRQKLADTQRLIEQTMETVHRFARELRPAMLDELGLVPALRSLLRGVAERSGLKIRLRADVVGESLADEQKTVLFRVAQESLTNVTRHAHARSVEIVLLQRKSGLRMEVRDDGRSFQDDLQDSARGRRRLGLLGMQERVRLVHGRFTVKPNPGKGTTVQVDIPLETAAPRRWIGPPPVRLAAATRELERATERRRDHDSI
jgi:two-component system sensor histidine kinase DegS